MTCSYFPLALDQIAATIKQMHLFESKESFKEKVHSGNNWKTE